MLQCHFHPPLFLFLNLLTLLLFQPCLADGSCYMPDGSVAPRHTPCNALAAVSACCAADDFCLDNNYCLRESRSPGSNRFSRGTCTAQSWGANCSYYCQDVNQDTPNVDIYHTDDTTQDRFCCANLVDSTTNLCPNATFNSRQPFSLSSGRIIWNRTDGSAMANGGLDALNASPALTITVTTSVAAVTITASATATTSAEHGARDNTTTAIAADVAVPLGLLLLASWAVIAVLWRRLRQRQREMEEAENPHDDRASEIRPSQQGRDRNDFVEHDGEPRIELQSEQQVNNQTNLDERKSAPPIELDASSHRQ